MQVFLSPLPDECQILSIDENFLYIIDINQRRELRWDEYIEGNIYMEREIKQVLYKDKN